MRVFCTHTCSVKNKPRDRVFGEARGRGDAQREEGGADVYLCDRHLQPPSTGSFWPPALPGNCNAHGNLLLASDFLAVGQAHPKQAGQADPTPCPACVRALRAPALPAPFRRDHCCPVTYTASPALKPTSKVSPLWRPPCPPPRGPPCCFAQTPWLIFRRVRPSQRTRFPGPVTLPWTGAAGLTRGQAGAQGPNGLCDAQRVEREKKCLGDVRAQRWRSGVPAPVPVYAAGQT